MSAGRAAEDVDGSPPAHDASTFTTQRVVNVDATAIRRDPSTISGPAPGRPAPAPLPGHRPPRTGRATMVVRARGGAPICTEQPERTSISGEAAQPADDHAPA